MEPIRDALTTSCKPARSALMAMISSVALPNVALSSPPTPSPDRSASCSVARPSHPAQPPGQWHDSQSGCQEDQQVLMWRNKLQEDGNGDEDQHPIEHGCTRMRSMFEAATDIRIRMAHLILVHRKFQNNSNESHWLLTGRLRSLFTCGAYPFQALATLEFHLAVTAQIS
jgi:hypothetical protein